MAALLSACSASIVQRAVNDFGVIQEAVASKKFKHQIFRKQGEGRLLHVYIEGDGRP